MSSAYTIRCSSPSTSTSVPEYLKDYHIPDAHLDVLVGTHRDDLGALGYSSAVVNS
jgi:hypothetical protein